jgi:hypothetical protein
MDRSERIGLALQSSSGMLEAARNQQWDEAIRQATVLTDSLSDGHEGWLGDWSEAEKPSMTNILLNLQQALELMQHRRDDLRKVLGGLRNQQRLNASYGGV